MYRSFACAAILLILGTCALVCTCYACPVECGEYHSIQAGPCIDTEYGSRKDTPDLYGFAKCDVYGPGGCSWWCNNNGSARIGTQVRGTGPCVDGEPTGTLTEIAICGGGCCSGTCDGACTY